MAMTLQIIESLLTPNMINDADLKIFSNILNVNSIEQLVFHAGNTFM